MLCYGNLNSIILFAGIIQMRPSYSYYDKQDKRKTDKNKADSEDEEKEPEAQQVITINYTYWNTVTVLD